MMNTQSKLDQSWKSLYKAGGIAAYLYVAIAIILPAVMYMINPLMDKMNSGIEVLHLISSDKLSWLILQTTVLGTSFLAIISFTALFMALKHVNKSYALIGTLIALVCHILFIAYYPVLLGLTHLAENFQVAGETQQDSLAVAAEA